MLTSLFSWPAAFRLTALCAHNPPPELILGIKGSRIAGLDAIAQNVIAYAQQPSTNRGISC